MIAISQTIAPIQLATIDVACAKPADPSDEYGANFLQTLVQMNKANSQVSLTDPEIIERKDSTGAVSTDDDTETPVEDWLAEPLSWLALTQTTVLVPIPDTTLVTSILMPQHNFEPEDEKILLDQNIALPTSTTKILGFDAVIAEGFHLLETGMTLKIEAPIDDQTAAILAGPIAKNIASKDLVGLTEPLAADDTTWQPSPPVSSKNATGTSELVPVSPPTQGAVDSQLLSDTALAGAELKVHLASLAERQTSAEMRPPATVSKHEEGKKPEQKEQRPTAAEMIWRQKWSSGASDTTSKALPTITSIVTSQTAPSQMQLTASSTNFASVTWHQNASNGPDSLPQNDLVKSPVRPHMAIPTPPFPIVTVPPVSVEVVDPSSAASALPGNSDAIDQATFITADQSVPPTTSAGLSNLALVSTPPAILTSLPSAVAPIVVDMLKTGTDGDIELALLPEELGRLTISIKQDGDNVQVTVLADRPETLDLMRRHSADLVTDLRQAGYIGASVSFGHGNQGQHSRSASSDQNRSHPQPEPHHPQTDPKPTSPARAQNGSGIDMRL